MGAENNILGKCGCFRVKPVPTVWAALFLNTGLSFFILFTKGMFYANEKSCYYNGQ